MRACNTQVLFRFFEAFLESAPQLIIQGSIAASYFQNYYQTGTYPYWLYFQAASLLLSIISISWSVVVQNRSLRMIRDDKVNIWPHEAVLQVRLRKWEIRRNHLTVSFSVLLEIPHDFSEDYHTCRIGADIWYQCGTFNISSFIGYASSRNFPSSKFFSIEKQCNLFWFCVDNTAENNQVSNGKAKTGSFRIFWKLETAENCLNYFCNSDAWTCILSKIVHIMHSIRQRFKCSLKTQTKY